MSRTTSSWPATKMIRAQRLWAVRQLTHQMQPPSSVLQMRRHPNSQLACMVRPASDLIVVQIAPHAASSCMSKYVAANDDTCPVQARVAGSGSGLWA